MMHSYYQDIMNQYQLINLHSTSKNNISAIGKRTDGDNCSTEQNGIRILVAEDNRINLLAITRFLTKKGFIVTGVADGKKAVEAIMDNEYDCIVMDIQMPHMDGMTATATIRATGKGATHPGVPIIAMTAYALPGDREKFLEAGMDDYIPKPLDFDDLERLLSKHNQNKKN